MYSGKKVVIDIQFSEAEVSEFSYCQLQTQCLCPQEWQPRCLQEDSYTLWFEMLTPDLQFLSTAPGHSRNSVKVFQPFQNCPSTSQNR